jgi:L-fuculose-phosphate aldolase
LSIKQQIIEIGKIIYEKNLTTGMSGNISFKEANKICITASGTCLGNLTEENIIEIDLDGNQLSDKTQKASSEKMMHVEIYRQRPEINSVIHAHPPYSTTLSIKQDYKFLPLLAESVVFLGNIPRIEYEMPSTNDLAKTVAAGFADSNAVLMSNHGGTVVGKNLKETFYTLETLEFYSQIYLLSGHSEKRAVLNDSQVQDLKKLIH